MRRSPELVEFGLGSAIASLKTSQALIALFHEVIVR
ncbi:hypothetical protein NIES4103_13680 [Nostoc sp. NIES-4103]|nr:hypothetical protein NIES4103_13680 [Nostoc sp. NIES-4103]